MSLNLCFAFSLFFPFLPLPPHASPFLPLPVLSSFFLPLPSLFLYIPALSFPFHPVPPYSSQILPNPPSFLPIKFFSFPPLSSPFLPHSPLLLRLPPSLQVPAEDKACSIPKTCKLKNRMLRGDRYLHTCFECPEVYPWLKNEFGLRL